MVEQAVATAAFSAAVAAAAAAETADTRASAAAFVAASIYPAAVAAVSAAVEEGTRRAVASVPGACCSWSLRPFGAWSKLHLHCGRGTSGAGPWCCCYCCCSCCSSGCSCCSCCSASCSSPPPPAWLGGPPHAPKSPGFGRWSCVGSALWQQPSPRGCGRTFARPWLFGPSSPPTTAAGAYHCPRHRPWEAPPSEDGAKALPRESAPHGGCSCVQASCG
mmetsp:Transcript_77405/g.169401  ORF Transcript_77405/g.169401 Transcript_77405/m.169401 type:complete len:219 (+) Transcript_77405:2798-3454(+)